MPSSEELRLSDAQDDECPDELREALRAGVAAARAGERTLARQFLTRVVQRDEHNLQAWLYLSEVVENPEEREICLENVLTLDPTHESARQRLDELRKQAELGAAPPSLEPVLPTVCAITGAPAMEEPSAPDCGPEYGCPYCAAPTHPQDRRCPACGGRLWVRSRQQEEQASKVGLLLVLQAICAGLNLAALGVVLAYVASRLGDADMPALLRTFLGLPSALPPGLAEQALRIAPQPIFFALLFFALLSLVAAIGTYLRWRPALYLLLVNGAWLVVAGLIGTLLLWQMADGEDATRTLMARLAMLALDAIILLVVLGLVLELRGDFFVEQKRLLLCLDRGAVAGLDFLAHGQRYLQEGKWALAALHLKRAVDQLPHSFSARMQLALALGHLRQRDAAARQLEEARQIRPQDPQIDEMAKWLQDRS